MSRRSGRGSWGLVDSLRGPRHLVKWNLGLGNSGQYRSEQVALINKTREAEARVTSFGRWPGRRSLRLSLSGQGRSTCGNQTIERASVGRGLRGRGMGSGRSYQGA